MGGKDSGFLILRPPTFSMCGMQGWDTMPQINGYSNKHHSLLLYMGLRAQVTSKRFLENKGVILFSPSQWRSNVLVKYPDITTGLNEPIKQNILYPSFYPEDAQEQMRWDYQIYGIIWLIRVKVQVKGAGKGVCECVEWNRIRK